MILLLTVLRHTVEYLAALDMLEKVCILIQDFTYIFATAATALTLLSEA